MLVIVEVVVLGVHELVVVRLLVEGVVDDDVLVGDQVARRPREVLGVDVGEQRSGLLVPAGGLEGSGTSSEDPQREVTLLRRQLVEDDERGVVLTEVRPGTADDERQLELRGRVQLVGLGGRGQGDRTLRPAETTLGVGHDRQVLGRAVQTADGPQLAQRLGISPGGVRSDAGGFPDDVDATATTDGCLRVLVSELGVDVEQAPGHDEVLADALGVLLAQATQTLTGVLGELAEVHVLGDLRLRDARLGRALVTSRTRPAVEPVVTPGSPTVPLERRASTPVTTVVPTEPALTTVATGAVTTVVTAEATLATVAATVATLAGVVTTEPTGTVIAAEAALTAVATTRSVTTVIPAETALTAVPAAVAALAGVVTTEPTGTVIAAEAALTAVATTRSVTTVVTAEATLTAVPAAVATLAGVVTTEPTGTVIAAEAALTVAATRSVTTVIPAETAVAALPARGIATVVPAEAALTTVAAAEPALAGIVTTEAAGTVIATEPALTTVAATRSVTTVIPAETARTVVPTEPTGPLVAVVAAETALTTVPTTEPTLAGIVTTETAVAAVTRVRAATAIVAVSAGTVLVARPRASTGTVTARLPAIARRASAGTGSTTLVVSARASLAALATLLTGGIVHDGPLKGSASAKILPRGPAQHLRRWHCSRGFCAYMRKTPQRGWGVFREGCPAASYSPTPSPGQYHRRCEAELPGSEWDRAFPSRYDRRNSVELFGFPVCRPRSLGWWGGCPFLGNRTVDA